MILTQPKPRKATERERANIRKWVEKWRERYYLNLLEVGVIFHDYPEEAEPASDQIACAARIDCENAHEYHTAVLNVFPRFFEEKSLREQEFCIAHEMMHVIVDLMAALPFRLLEGQLVTQHEIRATMERVTDWMARIVFAKD